MKQQPSARGRELVGLFKLYAEHAPRGRFR